jgi:hypothetical protein
VLYLALRSRHSVRVRDPAQAPYQLRV